MSDPVLEIQTANAGASASGSISLATTLTSSDLVVVVMSRLSGGSHTVTINGSTPTLFNNWQNGTTGTRLYVYTQTGLTGTHSVSYTTGTSSVARFTVYVLRLASGSSITNSAISVWSTSSTAANTDEGPASLTVGAEQVAFFAGVTPSGTIGTFPSNPTPSSGWTVDRNDSSGNGNHSIAHHWVSSAPSVQANMQTSSSALIGTVMLVAGSPVSSPLTSTFVGWGNPIF